MSRPKDEVKRLPTAFSHVPTMFQRWVDGVRKTRMKVSSSRTATGLTCKGLPSKRRADRIGLPSPSVIGFGGRHRYYQLVSLVLEHMPQPNFVAAGVGFP